MKCLVITKKHISIGIFIISATITAITFTMLKPSPKAVTAFNSIEPEKIVSHVLPSASEKSIKEKFSEMVDNIKEIKPSDIIKQNSPIFEKEITPTSNPTTPVPTTASTPTPTPSSTPVEEKHNTVINAEIKNETSYEVTASDFVDEPLEIPENPAVLIVHTHTTESYMNEESGRSVDDTKNMIMIGKVIADTLTSSGIKVIHDKTVHDYPSYQGAYSRSLKTIQNQVAKNPDIAVILDIHRDAIIKSDGTKVKLTTDINGKKSAQIMLVCGTNDSGLSHKNWQSNLNFALKIQEYSNQTFPGLMRAVNLRKERFNQHITPGSLILEIGTHGNTLQEAVNGAEAVAHSVASVIKRT